MVHVLGVIWGVMWQWQDQIVNEGERLPYVSGACRTWIDAANIFGVIHNAVGPVSEEKAQGRCSLPIVNIVVKIVVEA